MSARPPGTSISDAARAATQIHPREHFSGNPIMAQTTQDTPQSGKKVLFNVIAFMLGTTLLLILVKYLLG